METYLRITDFIWELNIAGKKRRGQKNKGVKNNRVW